MTPNFEVFGSLVRDLNGIFSHYYFLALPLGMLFSVVIAQLQSGSPNYPDILKRSLVATILLISFPEISNLIIDVCDGIAQKIDTASGMDTFLRMVQEKSKLYSEAKSPLLLKFDDLIIAVLNYASYFLVYIARYVTIALYYFFWVLLSVLSPLLIFCYLFPSLAHMTRNLYVGLVQVASWKIMWAIQSAMLTTLALGNIYRTEGHYVTVIALNFVVALGLLFIPMLVNQLFTQGMHGAAQTLGVAAAMAIFKLPMRLKSVTSVVNSKMGNLNQMRKTNFSNRQPNKRR